MNLAVIGTGYVGLVSGTCFAEMGNQVICVDNNQDKLEKLQNAEVTIYEPGLDFIFYRNIAKKRLSFTDDLKHAVESSEIIFLCLPTPQGEDGSADLKYVFGIAEDIGKILEASGGRDYKVIVNKSTVPVGTADKVRSILKKFGLASFDVVSNPEFLREGFAVEDFMKPDRIVVGSDSEKALEMMKILYEPFVRQGNPILEMDTASAEVTKYAANSYLAMRITYMNELANFCEKVGANVDMVRKGMGTDTRIGKRFLFAGIGYGGSCFPKDVNALIKTSCDYESEMKILTVVDKVNREQKLVLVNKILKHFNGDINGRRFALWGLAFKPNTDDMREAPSVVVIKRLLELGASVSAYDPAAIEASKFYLKNSVTFAENEYDAVKNADALIIVTEWNEFRNPDFTILKNTLKEPVIFDGRNIFTPEKMQELGFTYYSIGRKPVTAKID
ncbi:MAG: UDP-glucose dehydrogenase family protein [Bacteroidota bacterium]|jgi:UDPglucose 6-dehydrogenase|nr:UDP-glucose/GDP-mannose dehydrogenase family protein [Ignavibacteria bacterium]MCU7498913.1 UDP-glucose/GDP-mannose dehydrogenase family protein [Ignavibacteria bacterium]MCU7513946.1 UDP-glucose/GDP-mannose dehydrogenase family protein [Ignavibacteria bacterium]MCU7521358.1 UDP-glucose/GDP-mannose dehydrogenase family protein [Ignavibacteria bacterium]MCU7524196.1 UDP-glucose/GDP-mannose dehydrogenase family protein [Ignavibacteria bacterium]